MARPRKQGIGYFPFDVDFFEDDKVALIEAEFGAKGVVVAIRLLCKVYKTNGYYYQWGEDECLLLSKQLGNGFAPNLVKEILAGLIRRSFFDKGVFDSSGILTSIGIQRRYLEAIKGRASVNPRQDVWLLETEKRFSTEKPSFSTEKPSFFTEKCDKLNKRKLNKTNSSCTNEPYTQEEDDVFFEILFWRNVIDPLGETVRFVEYNEKNNWSKLPTRRDRAEAIMKWNPEKKGIRRNIEFLAAWNKLYQRLKSQEPQIASTMLAVDTRGVINNGCYVIHCADGIRQFISAEVPQELKDYAKCTIKVAGL